MRPGPEIVKTNGNKSKGKVQAQLEGALCGLEDFEEYDNVIVRFGRKQVHIIHQSGQAKEICFIKKRKKKGKACKMGVTEVNVGYQPDQPTNYAHGLSLSSN